MEGKILIAEGKWDLAAAELKKTLQLDPNFSSAYDLLVQTYVATNKLPQALDQLQAQTREGPEERVGAPDVGATVRADGEFPTGARRV